MTNTEQHLLALLRRWKCGNQECQHEHQGEPSGGVSWRWCPECKAASGRTYEPMAVAGSDAEMSSYAVIRKVPTRGKLASMALRYDHTIFAPKQELFGQQFGGSTPVEIAAVMSQMLQLHEEAAEVGFYRPELEAKYCAMLDGALTAAAEDRTAD